jgi:hypothetical protein
MSQMHNPCHPGEVLKEALSEISVTDAAKRLGVGRVALSRLLNGATVQGPRHFAGILVRHAGQLRPMAGQEEVPRQGAPHRPGSDLGSLNCPGLRESPALASSHGPAAGERSGPGCEVSVV